VKLKDILEDEELAVADWIISNFEAGKISYVDAKRKLRATGNAVYIHELNMADELLTGDERTIH